MLPPNAIDQDVLFLLCMGAYIVFGLLVVSMYTSAINPNDTLGLQMITFCEMVCHCSQICACDCAQCLPSLSCSV